MTDQAIWADAPRQTAKPKRNRIRRALVGGALSDLGRLPRYMAFALLGGAMIWAPITGYLKTAPERYKSVASLILPGSGASASLNLNGIGQASSYASSAFASNAVSPTETYKRLLGADRILAEAARSLEIPQSALGRPRVNLVDQTSLIHIEMVGDSPIDAQARADAILAAFFAELDALRTDEVDTREDSGLQAIADYRRSVSETRAEIAALQAESGLLSMDQYEDLVDRHLALTSRVQELSAVLSDKSAEVAQLESRLGVDARKAAATLKLFADGSYVKMLQEGAVFEAALAEAQAHYGPSHPKVQEARQARDGAAAVALDLAVAITALLHPLVEILERFFFVISREIDLRDIVICVLQLSRWNVTTINREQQICNRAFKIIGLNLDRSTQTKRSAFLIAVELLRPQRPKGGQRGLRIIVYQKLGLSLEVILSIRRGELGFFTSLSGSCADTN